MKKRNYLSEDTWFSSSEQGQGAIKCFKQQLKISNRTEQTIRNYFHSLERLMNFPNEPPENLDEIKSLIFCTT